MTYACTEFPAPVLCSDNLSAYIDIIAVVCKLTAVSPVALYTRDETEFLKCEKSCGCRLEVVEAYVETVAEEITLKAYVEPTCGFPLDSCITDFCEGKSCYVVKEEG